MSLTERNRSILYQRLNDIVGDEEAVGQMLSHFPTDDSDRPASELFVAAEIGDVRAEVAQQGADIRAEVAEQGADIRAEVAELRTEMRTGFADVRAESAEREQRLMEFVHQEVRSSMRWTLGFLVSSQAVLVTAVLAAG